MTWLDRLNGQLKTVSIYEQLCQTFQDVGGFLQDREGYALLLLAALGPGSGEVVEIGSFKGRSTCFLAFGARMADRGLVTAIDPFSGSPEHQADGSHPDPDIVQHGSTFAVFTDNLRRKGLTERVRPLRMTSAQAARDWQAPIRLLFIDGDHSYEATKVDFDSFERFVEPGGIICFHDIGIPVGAGCTRFVEELLATDARYQLLLQLATLAVVRKQ